MSPAGCAPPATRSHTRSWGPDPRAGAVGGKSLQGWERLAKDGVSPWEIHCLPSMGTTIPSAHRTTWHGRSRWEKGAKSRLDLCQGNERKLMQCYHCLVSAGAVPI